MNVEVERRPTGVLWFGLALALLIAVFLVVFLSWEGGPVDFSFLVVALMSAAALYWAYVFSKLIWENHREGRLRRTA